MLDFSFYCELKNYQNQFLELVHFILDQVYKYCNSGQLEILLEICFVYVCELDNY